MTASPHDPYRSRLAALADGRAQAPALAAAVSRRWECAYGRFFPGGAPWASLVFMASEPGSAQAVCTVEVFERRPTPFHQQTECVEHAAAGWLAVTPFPADAKLPGIGAVLSAGGRPTVVRYRPGKRCTIRYEDESGQPAAFAKLYPDGRGQRLHAESAGLWQASCTGELTLAVARPLRWDESTGAFWQDPVGGQPVLKTLFGPNGRDLAGRMGEALASLTHSLVKPQTKFDRCDRMGDSVRHGRELCRRVPWLSGAIHRLEVELERLHAAVPARPLVPVHGAPHSHQWLEVGVRLGLVDFDDFAWGDPELDVATFITEMDFEKNKEAAARELNQAFLAGYERRAGPLDTRLLTAYCAHKRLTKALKFACALHPQGDLRAEQALGRALTCVLAARSTPEACP